LASVFLPLKGSVAATVFLLRQTLMEISIGTPSEQSFTEASKRVKMLLGQTGN